MSQPTTETFTCLYCGFSKSIQQASLEHAIPKSLGGAHAPSHFKIYNVCTKCNNDLGSYVDASFSKSWFVSNGLATAAHRLYDGTNKVALPLTCLGPVNIPGLHVPKDFVAESWLGPSGETMVWIRPKSDELYWFAGGDPRHRSEPSTVYWFPTSDDPMRWKIGSDSLTAAFKKRKHARKLLGVPCEGFPGRGHPEGFDAPSELEMQDIAAIRSQMGTLSARIGLKLDFDRRFICKLALGVGYSLFGQPFAADPYADELRKGCWPKGEAKISVRGVSWLSHVGDSLRGIAGYPGAVSLIVLHMGDDFALIVSIDEGTPFIMALAPGGLHSERVNNFQGYALLLFPSLRSSVELTVQQLFAHRGGSSRNSELKEIDKQLRRAKQFWESLPRLRG